jgi:hypothetical protein
LRSRKRIRQSHSNNSLPSRTTNKTNPPQKSPLDIKLRPHIVETIKTQTQAVEVNDDSQSEHSSRRSLCTVSNDIESTKDLSPLQRWWDESISEAPWSPLHCLPKEHIEYCETLDLNINLDLKLDSTFRPLSLPAHTENSAFPYFALSPSLSANTQAEIKPRWKAVGGDTGGLR